MRTHLFVAPGSAAFGEVLLGLRLARELHARGDRVCFLAPAAHEVLLAGTPFPHGRSDAVTQVLDRALPDVVRDRRADTVVLLDLAVTLLACAAYRIDPGFLARLPVPLVAFDLFDVGTAGGRTYDMCEATIAMPAVPGARVRRLVPVPFARPDADGACSALSAVDPEALAARAATRAALGLLADEPLIVLVTASFQARALSPFQARAVAALPVVLAAQLRALGAVRLLHVGPRPLPDLGPAYRHRGQVPPAEFRRLLAAADVLYTLNLSATSVATALELDLPVVVAVSSLAGGAAESARRLAAPPSPAVRAVLERIAPLYPFRVFPLGLHAFMAPLLGGNPYLDAVNAVELFDEAQAVTALRRLLYDPGARAAARARAAAYRAAARALPGLADRFYSDQ